MSDILEMLAYAKHYADELDSNELADLFIDATKEVQRLRDVLIRVGNSPYPISEHCSDADRALFADLVVSQREEQEQEG